MIMLSVLGLVLPGYFLARLLRLNGAWTVAFPFSAVVLTATVVAFAILGVPLRAPSILAALAAVGVLSLAGSLARPSMLETTAPPPRSPGERSLRVAAVGLATIVLIGMGFRAAMYPLTGPDTVFRWDALPRLMLAHEGLSFFPPVTPGDFESYLYPDGFPPLVASVYWWLYASWGGPWPALSSVAVVLQAGSCLALTYRAARERFGPSGGALALAALSSSSLFLNGVAIGQETGYTALSVAGQLAFALAAARAPGASLVVAAGLFAGLGGLAREYGPSLSLVGFAVLASHRVTWRFLPLFCLTSFACAGPWFLRNWARTGNPMYPQDFGLGLPCNAVHAGLIATYKRIFGVRSFDADDWLGTAAAMAKGAPLALLVGVPGLLVTGRRGAGLGVSALLAVGLWLASVGYTSGGVGYSLRVLNPAWVALSVASGALGPALARSGGWGGRLARSLAIMAVVACGGHAALGCWAHPAPIGEIGKAILSTRTEPLDRYPYYVAAARAIDRSGLPVSGILVDNVYLAIALQRQSRFRPVMIWDPAVAFVFDQGTGPTEARRRLIGQGIRLVAIQAKSSNNPFLDRSPLYREDAKNWPLAWVVRKQDAIYLLPPVEIAPPIGPN